MDKSKRRKKNIGKWIVFTLLYGIFLMWIVGTISYYYPNPVHVGGGQYFDLSIGALVIGGSIFIILMSILFKKLKNR